MNKYQPLFHYLLRQKGTYIKLGYTDIERIISAELPLSATKHRAWWSNGGHEHADAWTGAGWKVSKVHLGKYVEFNK